MTCRQTVTQLQSLMQNRPMLQQIIITVFQAACRHLELDHAALIEVDKENSRVLNNR